MHIPTIQFRYSWVYDQNCVGWSKDSDTEQDHYPTYEEIQDFIQTITPMWNDVSKQVLTELSHVTGLPWHKEIIDCYVVGSIIPFSDPLTIPVYATAPDYFIDVLVHELIHQLFTQGNNLERAANAWEYIDEAYNAESNITRIHIPLHAIHAHMYQTFFSEERLQRDIEWISYEPNYKRSWDIVLEKGYQSLLKEFASRI